MKFVMRREFFIGDWLEVPGFRQTLIRFMKDGTISTASISTLDSKKPFFNWTQAVLVRELLKALQSDGEFENTELLNTIWRFFDSLIAMRKEGYPPQELMNSLKDQLHRS
jgi:hypothetical protein